jgi:hypothetical protein
MSEILPPINAWQGMDWLILTGYDGFACNPVVLCPLRIVRLRVQALY